MPDIDYIRNINGGFYISFNETSRKAVGNKALANRFEITFLTSSKKYLLGGQVVTDDYAGDASKFVGQSHSLNNTQSIASSMTIAIDKTVESILENQGDVTDPKERLVSAELIGLEVEGDTIYAKIEVVPEEYENYYPLYYSLPLRST